MKKFLCLLFCILGSLFAAFWTVAYVVLRYKENIQKFIPVIMLINAALIILSLILGFSVIKIHIDQWFQSNDSDIMSTKDKVLLITVLLITIICAGIFILTIVYNNIHAIRVSELDNMLLRTLMIIIANTFMSFAYYQHFQVAQLIE